MKKFADTIYKKTPSQVQNVLTSLFGLKIKFERYNHHFNSVFNNLIKSQWYSKEQIESQQLIELKKLLIHCQQTVPYYTRLFSKIKFNPDEIKSTADLRRIPVLTKDDLRKNYEDFISTLYKNEKLIVLNTSGSTGTPLKIVIDNKGRAANYAFFERFKLWTGINRFEKSATFAGRVLVGNDVSSPPFWRSNLFFNNTQFSSYHLKEEYLQHYAKKLTQLQPRLIDSYPSSIYLLAKYLVATNNNSIRPKSIITSSETLLDYQRDVIEQAFSCRVFDQYGSTEQAIFISQCEYGTYHIHPEYGITEILDKNGGVVVDGIGELVGTGYTNYVMPLIRYKIGDSACSSLHRCTCGRHFQVINSIAGRTDDLIKKKDGTPIGRLDPIFKGISPNSIIETQIVQDRTGIIVRMVKGNSFHEQDADTVVSELKKRVGEGVVVYVKYEKNIEKNANGKFKAVICEVY